MGGGLIVCISSITLGIYTAPELGSPSMFLKALELWINKPIQEFILADILILFTILLWSLPSKVKVNNPDLEHQVRYLKEEAETTNTLLKEIRNRINRSR